MEETVKDTCVKSTTEASNCLPKTQLNLAKSEDITMTHFNKSANETQPVKFSNTHTSRSFETTLHKTNEREKGPGSIIVF